MYSTNKEIRSYLSLFLQFQQIFPDSLVYYFWPTEIQKQSINNKKNIFHFFPHFTEKRKEFKKHRKDHYNEFSKVKLARKLIEEELKALEEDDDDAGTSAQKPVSAS